MRTEVKIAAIVAGIVIVLAAVWYFAVYRPNSHAAPNDVVSDGSRKPADGPLVETGEGQYVMGSGRNDTTTRPARNDPFAGLTPAPGTAGGGAATAQTYLTKAGDTFASIALDRYGNSSLASKIAEANPTVRPPLGTGITLRIPPRDTVTLVSVTPGTGTVAPGTVGTDPQTGRKFYVVKQGDSGGFSSVAAATLGNAKYWTLIAKANPDVNSTSLRPGQKLWVPDKPADAPAVSITPPAGTPGARTTRTTPTVAAVRTGAPLASGRFD